MKDRKNNCLLRLRLAGVRHDTLTAGPEFIHMDITNACDLRCSFCWIHSPLIKKRPPVRHLPFTAIRRIIDAGTAWNTATFGISGDGEPTLHPDIAEIIDYATKNGQSLLLWTNLHTASRTLLAKLCKAQYLCVTLCATEEKEYRQIHGGDLKRVCQNLKTLVAVRKKFGKPAVILSYILSKQTYGDLAKAITFAETHEIPSIDFKLADCSPETRKIALNRTEQTRLAAQIKNVLRRKTPVATNLRSLLKQLTGPTDSLLGFEHCWVGWFSLFFGYDGQARLCCFYDRLSAGSVLTASPEEIWYSKELHRLRLKAKYDFDIHKRPWKDECRWCPFMEQNTDVEKRLKNL